MNRIELIHRCEQSYESLKKYQNRKPESVWYGAYYGNQTVPCDGVMLYISPESKYYKNEELLEQMHCNMDFFLRMQFPNGLVSLWNCNIISPPDTAFIIVSLEKSLRAMEKANLPELDSLREKIERFLRQTIPGMVTGGFHTPNHRWVISCALALLYRRFGGEELKARVEQFVAEGIDMNDSGEWTERSNGAYSNIVDEWCYHVADIFGIDAFYEAIRKNLTMMQYMMHPSDWIVTEYSTRQDKGVQINIGRYAVPYLLMALKDRNGHFAGMAKKCMERSMYPAELLIYLYLYEDELKNLPEPIEPDDCYLKLLNAGHVSPFNQKHSGFGDTVLRYRNKELSVTVMAGQQDFLFVQYGKARAVCVKLPIGWFGMGGASFMTLEQLEERKFKLATPLYGSYMEVLSPEVCAPYGGNFRKMPNEERKRIDLVETSVEIVVTLKDDGLSLDVTMGDLPYLLAQMVFSFDQEGALQGNGLETMENGVVQPQNGKVTYWMGDDFIELCGESSGHDSDFIRGDTLNRDLKNVIFNALSPKDWHIEIKCGSAKSEEK